MARIRNPQAFAAWLARKQMDRTQQQNVQAYNRGGIDEQTRQRLLDAVAQQAAYDQSMPQQQQLAQPEPITKKEASIFESETSIFAGDIFKGNNDHNTIWRRQ